MSESSGFSPSSGARSPVGGIGTTGGGTGGGGTGVGGESGPEGTRVPLVVSGVVVVVVTEPTPTGLGSGVGDDFSPPQADNRSATRTLEMVISPERTDREILMGEEY